MPSRHQAILASFLLSVTDRLIKLPWYLPYLKELKEKRNKCFPHSPKRRMWCDTFSNKEINCHANFWGQYDTQISIFCRKRHTHSLCLSAYVMSSWPRHNKTYVMTRHIALGIGSVTHLWPCAFIINRDISLYPQTHPCLSAHK